MTAPVATAELMAVVLARELRDGDLGGAGMNALVPTAAMALAQRLHTPNLVVCGEHSINPRPDHLPVSGADVSYHDGAEAIENELSLLGHSHRGLNFWFYSGLQIDAYGNVNMHLVRDGDRVVRGPGVGNISYGISCERTYLYPMRHERRLFPERVDFISVFGRGYGGSHRADLGLPTPGPAVCVTPLCVFRYDVESGRARLESVHPGVTVDQVLERTGFAPLLPDGEVPVTAGPTADELTTLRALDRRAALRQDAHRTEGTRT